MTDHFMLSDLLRTAEAFLVFSVVTVAPGYVLAWMFDFLAFRQRSLLARMAIAVPLSLGICPTITYLLWRFVSPGVWFFYGACAITCAFLLVGERHGLFSPAALRILFRHNWVFLAIVAGWMVVAALALVDLQIGNRLYFPTVTYDYSLRSSVVASITRSGVPAQNPFFFPGRTFTMHYHYFWFILCSATQRIAGSTIASRHAVIAGTVWCGIGMLAVVALYLRFFQNRAQVAWKRRTLLAIGLLAVTGLDIIPVVLTEYAASGYFADLEWWNEQVAAWVTTVFWTPHHLAGLIACLMGFLLVWDASRRSGRQSPPIPSSLTAGLMFASAAGLSIHVTLVFAVFLLVWITLELARRHRAAAGLVVLAGLIAAVLSIPFLLELFSGDSAAPAAAASDGGSFPFLLAIRPFRPVDTAFALQGNGWKINLAHLLALPLNYFLELGFFLIVGVVECRRMWSRRHALTEDQRCSLAMAATSIIICTFVSSSVNASNDLGWRGFLPAQFILLLWGGEWLAEGALSRARPAPHGMRLGSDRRALVVATLILGVAGSLYALFKIRFYPLLSDSTQTPLYTWLSPDRRLGERTLALREIYDRLRLETPPGAVFQHNPRTAPEDFFHGIYADRQVAAEGMGCSVNHGGDMSLCKSRIGTIDDLFENPRAINVNQIDDLCARLSIDVLVVKDTDRAWQDRSSWVWKRKPTFQNAYGRAFVCGAPRIISASRSTRWPGPDPCGSCGPGAR